MLKDNNKYAGQPILGQLLNYIPQHIFKQSVIEYNADKEHKTVSTWDQFTFMFYGILTGSSTLREIGKNFALFGDKLTQCEIKSIPARSSISDANRKRKADVFGKLYIDLYQYYKKDLTNSYLSLEINGEIDPRTVEIFDSTTVSLFTDIFKNTGRIPQNGSTKGGIKAFAKITLSERVPNFIYLRSATTNEKLFLNYLQLSKGTITVFDKGFHKFSQYQEWTDAGIYYVTRPNNNAVFTILKQNDISEQSGFGVTMDATIELKYYCKTNKEQHTTQARLIHYKDLQGNEHKFLSNMESVKALTICMLYKNRWTIEPLFKQIKQNFELTYFLSDSKEGIKTQIWIAMIINLIFTVIHKQIKEAEDFATMVKIAAKNMTSYVWFVNFLKCPTIMIKEVKRNIEKIQLDLFNQLEGGGIFIRT
jgi:hypothetical protein